MSQEILNHWEAEAEESAVAPVCHLYHHPKWYDSNTAEGIAQTQEEEILVHVTLPQGATMHSFVQKVKVSHKRCDGQGMIDYRSFPNWSPGRQFGKWLF